jgi:tripartite-type tricarboxylate transporter receptor subunit TctC
MIDRSFSLRLSRRSFCKRAIAAGAVWVVHSSFGTSGGATPGPCPGIAGGVIRWIVPTPPGGGYDQYSRLIQPFYESRLGARIVIENISGAGTILGSKRLAEAKPDGLTQGILNACALMMARLGGDAAAPDLVQDFTILGRICRSPHIWAVRGDSPLKSLQDVIEAARTRPIVFGITEFGSSNPMNAIVACNLLGIEFELVPGYQGTNGISLAAMRGEIDIAPLTFEARAESMEAGDLRPILQLTTEPISSHPSLDGVPCLGGEHGAAARRASEQGRDVARATADARALSLLLGAGRLTAAPKGLSPDLAECLEKQLELAVSQPECRATAERANQVIEFTGSAATRADLMIAREGGSRFIPVIKEARRKVQG